MNDKYSPQKNHLVTFGESIGLFDVESIGPLRPGARLTLSFGGSECNVAIGASRLGQHSTWIGVLGNDSIGDMALREMKAEGVTVHARRTSAAPTGIMLKEHPASSFTRIQYFRDHSAGAGLTLGDFHPSVISSAQVLHLTGVTLALSDAMPGLAREVIRLARESDVLVSMDLNYRASLWSQERARSVYSDLLPEVDIVFAGEHEAEIATRSQRNPVSLARALSEFGPTQSIVTCGPNGAVAVIDDQDYSSDGLPIDVVDTVGAGDAFVAGYLSEFMRGAQPQTRLEFANTVGARACQVPGDWEGLPYRRDLSPKSDSVLR